MLLIIAAGRLGLFVLVIIIQFVRVVPVVTIFAIGARLVVRIVVAAVFSFNSVTGVTGIMCIPLPGIKAGLFIVAAFVAQHMGEMIVVLGADIGEIKLAAVGRHMIVWQGA